MERIRLCPIDGPKDDEPVAIPAGAYPPLAVYKVDGKFYVTSNICTHGNAHLTDGYQDGATIECPFHGGAFDIPTGAATTYPCQIALKTYAVTIEDGWVTIDAPGEPEG